MEKLHSQSLEIQKIMYEEIKKISSEFSKNEKNQEAILQKCSFLLEKQKRDNKNVWDNKSITVKRFIKNL